MKRRPIFLRFQAPFQDFQAERRNLEGVKQTTHRPMAGCRMGAQSTHPSHPLGWRRGPHFKSTLRVRHAKFMGHSDEAQVSEDWAGDQDRGGSGHSDEAQVTIGRGTRREAWGTQEGT